MQKKIVLITLFLYILCTNILGNDTILSTNDTLVDDTSSINIEDKFQKQLQELSQLMRYNEQQRIADSVRRADLKNELTHLRITDQQKRTDLEAKIAAMEKQNSDRLLAEKEKVRELRKKAIGFPVAPFEDTIFYIYTKIGPIKPNERAKNITTKIESISEIEHLVIDSIAYSPSENTIDIIFENTIIMSISDYDALWFEKSREALAKEYTTAIKKSIQKDRDDNKILKVILRTGSTLIVIIFIYLLTFYVNKLYKKSEDWIEANKSKYLKGIKLKSYHFLTAEEQTTWAKKANNILKWLTITIIIYLALPTIFSIFPFTEGWSKTLFNWIWFPFRSIITSFFNYLPNLAAILVIYFVTKYIIKVIRYLAHEVEIGKLKINGFHADWAMPTFAIVKFLLYAFMFVVIFPYLPGSESNVFKGVSVFLGVLLSLGSSSAIANMVAGLVITYMRPYKLGDRIKIGEITGDVIEKTLLVTRIRTIKNEEITIPNAAILSGHTINYTAAVAHKGLIVHTTITIGYDEPWAKVHEALLEAAARTNYLQEDPKPFILQTALNDFYVAYEINAYTLAVSKQAIIYSELHQRIQDVFCEKGIEITSPHFRAVRDGNSTTIPTND